jgi:hypothetical protein
VASDSGHGFGSLEAARRSRRHRISTRARLESASLAELKVMAEEQADGSNYRDDSKTIDENADGSNYRDDSKEIPRLPTAPTIESRRASSARPPQARALLDPQVAREYGVVAAHFLR